MYLPTSCLPFLLCLQVSDGSQKQFPITISAGCDLGTVWLGDQVPGELLIPTEILQGAFPVIKGGGGGEERGTQPKTTRGRVERLLSKL